MKIDRYIEIVRAQDTRLSSLSLVSAEAMQAALAKYYSRVEITNIRNRSDLEQLCTRRPDVVVPGAIYIVDSGRKVWLSDYFDKHQLAYTGSETAAHKFENDKPSAKRRVMNGGLKSSLFIEIKGNRVPREEEITLPYPLFVKPSNRGGGSGIDENSVVHNYAQLQSKANALAREYHTDVLVEQYLPGREFSVAILNHDSLSEHTVMPIELMAPVDSKGERMLSATVKTANAEQVTSQIDNTTKQRVSELALRAFHALGARDYGRIDIRLDANGHAHFLEANLIPSLIEGYGSFPKACSLNLGMDYEDMVLHIVALGLARGEAQPRAMLADEPLLPAFQPAIELA